MLSAELTADQARHWVAPLLTPESQISETRRTLSRKISWSELRGEKKYSLFQGKNLIHSVFHVITLLAEASAQLVHEASGLSELSDEQRGDRVPQPPSELLGGRDRRQFIHAQVGSGPALATPASISASRRKSVSLTSAPEADSTLRVAAEPRDTKFRL